MRTLNPTNGNQTFRCRFVDLEVSYLIASEYIPEHAAFSIEVKRLVSTLRGERWPNSDEVRAVYDKLLEAYTVNQTLCWAHKVTEPAPATRSGEWHPCLSSSPLPRHRIQAFGAAFGAFERLPAMLPCVCGLVSAWRGAVTVEWLRGGAGAARDADLAFAATSDGS